MVYLVHDLADPAVARRVRMLRGAATVILAGFRRSERPVQEVAGVRPLDFGRTADGRFGQRIVAVARTILSSRDLLEAVSGSDVIIARQLEMLLIAAVVRRRAAPKAALVYECLDIHRLLLRPGLAGAALRAIERRLLRACDLLLVSSPRFLSAYFDAVHPWRPPALVLENRVLRSDIVATAGGPTALRRAPPGLGAPPWRIGWFGVIRCRRSLDLLTRLAGSMPGQIEVVIGGRVVRTLARDFKELLATTPGLSFIGPYDRHTDLARIYGDVHFAWAMDFSEMPGNSEWLLPNRLYEGSLHRAVPLALDATETAKWLADRQCGVRLSEPLESALPDFFGALDASGFAAAQTAVAGLRPGDLVDDDESCQTYRSVLANLR